MPVVGWWSESEADDGVGERGGWWCRRARRMMPDGIEINQSRSWLDIACPLFASGDRGMNIPLKYLPGYILSVMAAQWYRPRPQTPRWRGWWWWPCVHRVAVVQLIPWPAVIQFRELFTISHRPCWCCQINVFLVNIYFWKCTIKIYVKQIMPLLFCIIENFYFVRVTLFKWVKVNWQNMSELSIISRIKPIER